MAIKKKVVAVPRAPKSVFKLAYFVLTLVVLWQLGGAIFEGLAAGAQSNSGIFAAFTGEGGADTARFLISAFVVAMLICFFLLYVIFEAFEGGHAGKNGAVFPTGRGRVPLVVDFLCRAGVVGILIFAPKFGQVESYATAWKLFGWLAFAYTVWTLSSMYCYGLKRVWDLYFAASVGVICFSIDGLVVAENGAYWGLLIILLMFLVIVQTLPYAVHLMKREGSAIAASALSYFRDWD